MEYGSMKLAIISHTPHYKKGNDIVGWGPTIREINHLSEMFEEIYHVAPLHIESAPDSSIKYASDKVKFIPIRPYGGKKLSEKLSILTTLLNNLKAIKKTLNKVDWAQFRAPTAMGLYVLPYLSMRSKPKRWVKYAGNWKMEKPPLSYRFQRWWLENNFQRSKVTINGQWENQKPHIINFENPCLDNEELRKAKITALAKNFNDKLIICFAGALTGNKGVGLILKALKKIKNKSDIKEVIFAGDGTERKLYEEMAKESGIKILFKGFQNRTDLEKIYEEAHLILLPSESEGFPKVIAEAAAYGCVPVVSDVSSIGQYFNDDNSFLLKEINSNELADKIHQALNDRVKLKQKSINCLKVAELFTYENYMKNLREKIFNLNLTDDDNKI